MLNFISKSSLTNQKVNSMSEAKPDTELGILGLIDWLDSKQKDEKNPIIHSSITEVFRGETRSTVIAIVITFFIIWLGAYEYGINLALRGALTFNSLLVIATAVFSGIAVVIAGITFISPYLHENEINVRYRRALDFRKKDIEKSSEGEKVKDFTEEEKPLLKALIIVMSSNPKDFTLRQLYDLDKNQAIFSRDRLLERICSREEIK